MHASSIRSMSFGLGAGVGLTLAAAVLMGQNASTPVKSETQYFATAEGDDAHLWVREGTSLRCVGHGTCTEHKHGADDHGHDHKEGDGHSH